MRWGSGGAEKERETDITSSARSRGCGVVEADGDKSRGGLQKMNRHSFSTDDSVNGGGRWQAVNENKLWLVLLFLKDGGDREQTTENECMLVNDVEGGMGW